MGIRAHEGYVHSLLVFYNIPQAVTCHDDKGVLRQQQHLAHIRLAFHKPDKADTPSAAAIFLLYKVT